MIIGNHNTLDKVFIVAELSANHNQDYELARKAVRIAAETGCDAIKLQTYTPDSLTLNIRTDEFKASGPWKDEYLYDLYAKACMPYEWHKPLKEYADELGILLFSSPFDKEAVDVCESIDVPAYKIASFEITDIPLIRYVASKKKPVIISTGVGNAEDIQLAVDTCLEMGNPNITLLQCTSAYPAPPENMNLLTIPAMKDRFSVEVGLSDHSLGNEAVITAVALGARIVEKHFTPDESIETPDHAFSLNPKQLREMVFSIRKTEKVLGEVSFEGKSKQFSRSIYTSKDINKGEKISSGSVRTIRPGNGLHPKYLTDIIGKTAKESVRAGMPFSWEFVV